ncbi:MAG: LssY C-terminal domain-containing protein [Rhizobiaceae bacterium]|nr:LssY C-terminal domain-containing protein [Rhizobiaceae bacterium]
MALGLAMVYAALAYLALPELWWLRDRGLTDRIGSFVTATPQGIAGDPINVGLMGPESEVIRALDAAGWRPADALTLKTAIEIGLSVAFDRPYAEAPVSTLLYDGRRQDLAFEKRDGVSPDRRHHVRFWRAGAAEGGAAPLWLGAASFDRGVGFSHDTGQITHHIGPDVDAERDLLMADLQATGLVAEVSEEPGIGATAAGRNGGGDPYFTDGLIKLAVLAAAR